MHEEVRRETVDSTRQTNRRRSDTWLIHLLMLATTKEHGEESLCNESKGRRVRYLPPWPGQTGEEKASQALSASQISSLFQTVSDSIE